MVLITVSKLSVEYSSLTLPRLSLELQVMSWLVASTQLSPPSGAVSVSVGTRMVKSALEVSATDALSTELTRTRTVVDATVGTFQEKVPSSAVEALMVLMSATKLSVEYSSFTLPRLSTELQVIS